MKLAKVVGSVVATRKDERLVGHKLLVVQTLMPGREGTYRPGRDEGGFAVAVDLVGAGAGETVILCAGSSARSAAGDLSSPVDLAIVGIVDRSDVDDREVL